MDAGSALDSVMEGQDNTDYRQVCVVDARGNTALFSGQKSLGIFSDAVGKNCVAGGNLLDNESVPQALVDSFETSSGHLAERLITALQAGLEAGGEAGDVHSCALLVVDDQKWPLVDLRMDWSDDCPMIALKKLWHDYQPQMQDYVTRALNPADAPSYGVPGDE